MDRKNSHQNSLLLKKSSTNPIISPKKNNDWESFTTLNPGAIYVNGKVHIFYRAMSSNNISSIGYATSSDGLAIETRENQPVYVPKEPFEINNTNSANNDLSCAGGRGGCEDPRVTLIGDTIYMIYVAFDGWTPPRLAMTHLSLKNLLAKRWRWSKSVLISQPNIVNKSGCLFPEKINGKYVFLHRIFPNILIDSVNDLNFDGKTKWLKNQRSIDIRPNKWDSRKIGAGAPPLKTKDGWLLIYYGVDDRNDRNYYAGAMLLDLKDPSKVLARSEQPIIKPTKHYENSGVRSGTIYPCGAVVVGDQLLIYYGGADNVICVASAELNTFLRELKHEDIKSYYIKKFLARLKVALKSAKQFIYSNKALRSVH